MIAALLALLSFLLPAGGWSPAPNSVPAGMRRLCDDPMMVDGKWLPVRCELERVRVVRPDAAPR